ncbi:TetR/AcrR family transcriptional regulator [Nonomuraea typhae]|uniref:TetR/AcrR family transcriptional regulator n=1 Tax=Nonomuraea typhae TaxID=2603600 RepID=UPI0012F871FE|nr:TetR/AcrR family transcriptional regulator [Nonomuraea typhae]
MVTDHRKQPRRRGAALHAAIFQATLDELAEVGYAKLTMERVAERARTGKASLYRRWPTRIELVVAAVYSIMPTVSDTPDTGSLRGDMLAALRTVSAALAGPPGEAMRGLLSEALGDSERAATLRQSSQGMGRRVMTEVVRRAVDRGEIQASAVTLRRLDVGQALIRQYFLFDGTPIPDELIVEVVDEIMVPLLGCPVP